MKKIFFLIIVFAASLILSCAKHPGDLEASIPPSTINIFSPVPNTVTHYGDSLSIDAVAIASKTIHGYDLRINKRNDTTSIFFYHGHQHNDTIMINKKWLNSVTTSADLVLSVLLYLDHNGNTSEKRIAFKVQ